MSLPSPFADEPMTVTHFRLIWRHFGVSTGLQDAILENTGVTPAMLETATSVTIGQQLQQVRNLNRLFGPGWFLEVPEELHFSAHGAITVAAQTAPTLGDALAVLCDFLEVRLPIHRARLRLHGKDAVFIIEPSARAAAAFAPDRDVWRPILFIDMISIKTLVAAMLAHPASDARFAFAGPRPVYADKLDRALGATASYDAGDDRMIIPASWLGVGSVFADNALYIGALANLNAQAAARARPPRALRYRIEQMLAERAAGRMDAVSCARALGLSRRTMTRRLAEEGTGFRELLDHDLRRRALEMVEAGGMTSARIADTLGYQNPTSFHRAMQRWTRPEALS